MAAETATLCCTLLFVGVIEFVSGDQETITTESGKNVTLRCRGPNNNFIVVKWSRADLEQKYVLLYRDGHFVPDEQHPTFKNRVDLQDRQMKDGDVSVILKNVTTADEGTYECRVVQRVREPLRLLSSINLSVVDPPPGPTGGTTEDGGSVGVIVGLSVAAVLLVAAVVGFVIYRKCKNKPNQGPFQPPAEQQQVEVYEMQSV